MTSEYESAAAVTARAPAKVNLQLAVGPARPDGFHSLVTVYHAVSLFDEVTVSPSTRTSIKVRGEDAATVPEDRTNLAWQAALALAAAAGLADRDAAVHIDIRKRIPAAAGMAGGSADAAATLVACNELWRTGLTGAELAEIGARAGQRRPVHAGGRHRGRTRPGRGADDGAGFWRLSLGAGLQPHRFVHARGVRDLRPAAGGPRCRSKHGRFNHGRFNHGRFKHGRFKHGRFKHGRFKHGRFKHGRFKHGRFKHGRFKHGRFKHGRFEHGRFKHGRFKHGRLRQGHRRVRPVRRATAQHRADDGAAVRRRHRRRAAAV